MGEDLLGPAIPPMFCECGSNCWAISKFTNLYCSVCGREQSKTNYEVGGETMPKEVPPVGGEAAWCGVENLLIGSYGPIRMSGDGTAEELIDGKWTVVWRL